MNPIDIVITETDPAPVVAGMIALRLDPQGRLTRFQAVPTPPSDTDPPASEPDWAALFEHAALDRESMTEADPRWLPPVFCDRQAAWTGSFADQPNLPVRVEAGSYRGRPVYFELVLPWSQAQQTAPEQGPLSGDVIGLVFLSFLLLGAVLLVRINLRLGRVDRRGAFRLATFMFICNSLIALFAAHHVPTFSESRFFFQTLAWGLMIGGMVWIAYLALEPYARRLWPDILISWSRLLAGRVRDPLIGRDVLIGGVAGVVMVLVMRLDHLLPPWLDLPAPEPISGQVGGFSNGTLMVLESTRKAIAMFFHMPQLVVSNAVAVIFLLILIRVMVRKHWLAAALTYLVFSLIGISQVNTNPAIGVPVVLITTGLMVGVLVRVGMLAFAALVLVPAVDQFAVLTLDLSAWYVGRSLLVLLLVAAVFVYAFYISLAGRRVLSDL